VGDLYLVERNGIFCVHGTINGRRIRASCRTSDPARAKIFLEDLRREHISGWRESYDNPEVSWKFMSNALYGRHRQSAIVRRIPFQIKAADIFGLMNETDFCCAVSGIPFSKKAKFGNGQMDPWAPSVDRIENRHGYLKDNVRVVCVIANIAMNQWGYDALLRLSKAVVRNAAGVTPELTHQSYNSEDQSYKPLISIVK
jgi:hypothetical protein